MERIFWILCCFSCVRGLKMQYQVALIEIIIFLLAMLLVGVAYSAYSTIIITQLLTQSQLILVKQDINSMSAASHQTQQYINQKQQFCIHILLIAQDVLRLSHLNQFFSLIENSEDIQIRYDQLFDCTNEKNFSSFHIQCAYPLFYYRVLGKQDSSQKTQTVQTFAKTIQQLNQFTLTLEAIYNSPMSVVSLGDPYIMAGYPQLALEDQDDPTKTIWYKNHLEKVLENFSYPYYFSHFSHCYQSYEEQQQFVSLTATIKGQSNNSIGISEQEILLSDENITNIPYNIMLVDQEGEVILVGIEGVTSIVGSMHIYDSNLTGFNYADYQIIKQNSIHLPKKGFNLFNTYQNRSVTINAVYFQEYNFTLVIYSNISITLQFDQEFNNLKSYFIKQVLYNQYTQSFIGAMVIILTVWTIHYIFKPLRLLMDAISFTIKSVANNLNVEIFKMLNKRKSEKVEPNDFSALRHCIFRFENDLQNRQNKKSNLCVLMESFHYPFRKEFQINPFKQQIIQLPNHLEYARNVHPVVNSFQIMKSLIRQSMKDGLNY